MGPIDSYRGKKVMITGGLGFIGSNLARRLVESEADILIVDSLIPDYGGNLFNIEDVRDQVRVNIADVRDRNGMDYLVRGQDYIFNLAGQVSHIDSMLDPYTDLEINCRSQLSLLEACRYNNPAVKIIHASTRQIYGAPDYLPVDERHLLHPTDVNGINKMAGEWYHILYNNVYGIRATSLRLTNTYGPRQLVKHNRQGFIGWFIRLAIDGAEISLYGDGKQQRDLNYVDDVVEAFLLAGATDSVNGEVYNLGGRRPVSLLEVVETLIDLCPEASYKLVPFPEDKKRIDIGDYHGDYTKIEGALGWKPQVSLRDGLARTIEYYRQHKEQYWE
ncbi:MAG: NAD-dependent epimerase/dehydratase family protein [Anaerolineae bacterium]|nr:NAD-dependent epimerase/dehydratase family protein [Anaerolineae bacterium]NIN95901.1 NAD-dependent epimerase/dehydratase family protein [Anaerolineae bacterium]NIQ78874.1 NAD-dependent epimerase/dehydratase family protein [Anaerolineae bacterium]